MFSFLSVLYSFQLSYTDNLCQIIFPTVYVRVDLKYTFLNNDLSSQDRRTQNYNLEGVDIHIRVLSAELFFTELIIYTIILENRLKAC